MTLSVPCLQNIPLQAFSYSDCNITRVLDILILFSLGGFAVTILLLFVFRPRREIKPLILSAIVLGLATIGFFYADLLPLIRQTDRAQLFVDSIPR